MGAPSSASSSWRLIAAFLGSLALAFVVGYLVVLGVRWVNRPAIPPELQTLPWRPAPVAVAPGASAMPALDVYLMHAGNRYRPDQAIALPTGSKFYLDLKASTSGTVRLQGINPAGEASQIWAGDLQGGQAVSTPGLTLQGQRGQERLRVVFSPASQPGVAVVEQLTVLHQ